MRRIKVELPPVEVKEFYTMREIAAIIGRSASTLSILYRRGGFIEFDARDGKTWLYHRDKVQEFLNRYEGKFTNPSRNRKKGNVQEEFNNNG